MIRNIATKASLPYLLPILLVLPALLSHLGCMPLLADEPTRALVALEMLISENYIVPTINGEYYYNKPPLYNWMLVGLYHLTGHINEWIIRIPTVVFTLLFSALMFWFIKKYTDYRIAFIVAVAYITSGRILFYDSFLGLIDTAFSTLIFLNFMFVYHFDQRKKYHYLFLITYLITAVTYMLKGLPGPVFQIITLFTFFTFIKRDFKMLFHFYHWLGIFLFIFLLSLYYFQYLKYNDLETLVNTIISESAKRTVVENNPLDSLMHILFFPVTAILNFLPFTIPFILIFKKNNFKTILNHSFLKYCLLILFANSIVYWLSPETVPRYLFMFLPLLYAISYVLYFEVVNVKFKIIYEYILFGICILIVLFFLAVPFISIVPKVPLKYPKLIFLIVSLTLLVVYYYKNKTDKIIIFCSILLLARIGFDWYVFPSRLQTEPEVAYRNYGIAIGKITKGKSLYIYKNSPVDHDISFYISRERYEILRTSFAKTKQDTYYIIDEGIDQIGRNKVDIYLEFYTNYKNTKLYLVKLKG